MNDDIKNIDELFQNALQDFEPEVPPYVWDNIEDELQGKKKRRAIIWFRRAAAVILLLLTFGSGYFFSEYHNSRNFAENKVTENESLQNAKKTEKLNTDNNSKKQNKKVENYIAENEINSAKINNSTDNTKQQNKPRVKTKNENQLENNGIANKKNYLAYHEKAKTKNVIEQKTNTHKNTDENTNKNSTLANTHLIKSVTGKDDNYTEVLAENDNVIEMNLQIEDAVVYNNNSENNEAKFLLTGKNIDQVTDKPRNNELKPYEAFVFTNQPAPNDYSRALLSDSISKIMLANNNLKQFNLKEIKDRAKEIIANENSKSIEWIIGGEISPLYAFNDQNFSSKSDMKESLNTQQNFINADTDTESGKNATLSYSGGIKVGFIKNNRLTIKSGIYYSKKEQRIENIPVERVAKRGGTKYYANLSNVAIKFTEASNTIINDKKLEMYDSRMEAEYDYAFSPNTSKSYYKLDIDLDQTFEYIEIPIMVKYKLIDRKIDFNVLGGISSGMLVKNSAKASTENNNLWSGETANINRFNYTASVGMGLEYELNKHLSLNIEPTLRYTLNPVSVNNDVYSYPYAFSVFTGMNYRF